MWSIWDRYNYCANITIDKFVDLFGNKKESAVIEEKESRMKKGLLIVGMLCSFIGADVSAAGRVDLLPTAADAKALEDAKKELRNVAAAQPNKHNKVADQVEYLKKAILQAADEGNLPKVKAWLLLGPQLSSGWRLEEDLLGHVIAFGTPAAVDFLITNAKQLGNPRLLVDISEIRNNPEAMRYRMENGQHYFEFAARNALAAGNYSFVDKLLAQEFITKHLRGSLLGYAVFAKNYLAIRYLVKNLGVDVNGWLGTKFAKSTMKSMQTTHHDETPLYIAVANGDLPTVQFLVEDMGANIAMEYGGHVTGAGKKIPGKTIIAIAEEQGQKDIVNYLRDAQKKRASSGQQAAPSGQQGVGQQGMFSGIVDWVKSKL
jgi:hypothetical protein